MCVGNKNCAYYAYDVSYVRTRCIDQNVDEDIVILNPAWR